MGGRPARNRRLVIVRRGVRGELGAVGGLAERVAGEGPGFADPIISSSPSLISLKAQVKGSQREPGYLGILPVVQRQGHGLLQDEVPHQFGVHGILEDQGHIMARIREEVSTRMSRADQSRLLHPRPGGPLLNVWRTSIGDKCEPYELTRFVMRGDRTGLLYYVPVE